MSKTHPPYKPATHIDDIITTMSRVRGETTAKYRLARAHYHAPTFQLPTYQHAVLALTTYFNHLERERLRIEVEPRPPQQEEGIILNLLQRAYGDHISPITDALHGLNGGLPAILDRITDQYIADELKTRTAIVITDMLESLTFDELLQRAVEYQEKYGHLLLPEDRVAPPAALIRKLRDGSLLTAHAKHFGSLAEHLR